MRLPITLLACGLLAFAAGGDAAAATFPYKAFVAADDVFVRSGPGENYYPTDKLKTGDAVEVYRHDPGGWCAIRPVPASFSWVSARYLRLGKGNIATVTEEHVAARVGSRSSDVRDVIQVWLHRGELVEVLDAGRDGPATAASANAWCKIAPPAGEFRWISSKFLDANFPRDGLRKPSNDDHWRGARGRPPASQPPAGGVRTTLAQQFEAEVVQLDLDLSMVVAEEPSIWRFDDLRTRSEALLDQAETAVERSRARLLANKIARFEEIKQRYDRVNAAGGESARLSPPPPGISPQADDGRYDGVGRLERVTLPRTGAPQYAPLDQFGRVRCYVTPGPGVNLRYYVGREVGINGVRGYMPEQQANHLTAQHINMIDDTLLR